MAKTTAPSTQDHLPIAGIQDGVVIMNDASVRAVLKIEPINFELKSQTEQDSIIYSYQAFLNSLDFPIQIVIHSKKLDLERYLMKMEESKKNLTSDLLRIQIEDYVSFVRRLISVANIMSKRFYVVVSYSAIGKPAGNPLGGFMHKQDNAPLLYQDQFERFRTEVYNRANMIAGGLTRLGVKVTALNTQELIELFYGVYNPDIATEERLTDIRDLNAGVVTSTGVLNENPPAQAPMQEAATPPPPPSEQVPNPPAP